MVWLFFLLKHLANIRYLVLFIKFNCDVIVKNPLRRLRLSTSLQMITPLFTIGKTYRYKAKTYYVLQKNKKENKLTSCINQ